MCPALPVVTGKPVMECLPGTVVARLTMRDRGLRVCDLRPCWSGMEAQARVRNVATEGATLASLNSMRCRKNERFSVLHHSIDSLQLPTHARGTDRAVSLRALFLQAKAFAARQCLVPKLALPALQRQ